MRKYIIEGLQMLDAQRAHMLAYLNEYGAQDQRARDQTTFYHGMKNMLETVSGCQVCTDTDGRHHAIKTSPIGDALRDSLQPFDRDRANAEPIIFATKRDSLGHRRYIAIDTEAQTFTTEPPRAYYIRDDIIEVGARDLAKLAEALTARYFEERRV